MTEYKSLGTFELKGRGTVYFVEYKGDTINRDNNNLVGSRVKIDGIKRTIMAVESHAITTISEGAKIGLLVDRTFQECVGNFFEFCEEFGINKPTKQ